MFALLLTFLPLAAQATLTPTPTPTPAVDCNITVVSCAYWRNHPELFYSTVPGGYDTWICDRFNEAGVDFGPMAYLNTSWDSVDDVHWIRLYCPYIAITAAMHSSDFNPCELDGVDFFGDNNTSACYDFAQLALQSAYLSTPSNPFPLCSQPRPQFKSNFPAVRSDEKFEYCEARLKAFINATAALVDSSESFGTPSLFSSASRFSFF